MLTFPVQRWYLLINKEHYAKCMLRIQTKLYAMEQVHYELTLMICAAQRQTPFKRFKSYHYVTYFGPEGFSRDPATFKL